MKKIILGYLVLFCCIMYGQNKISFSEISKNETNLSANFKNYEILKVNDNGLILGQGQKLTLSYKQDYLFELQVSRLVSNDYIAIIKKEDGMAYKKLDELGFNGKYFLNTDRSQNHQLALSLFENQYSFYVKSGVQEFYIEPLKKYNSAASFDEYVYYESKDIIGTTEIFCGVENKNTYNLRWERNQIQQPNLNCKTLELNFCVDYSFYASNNYSINATINKTFEIMNLSQLDYTIANGLAYDVNFKLKRHYIITCTDCNYWPTTVDLSANHDTFVQYAYYSQIFDTKADVNVFWEYSNSSPSNFGVGSQGVLTYCDPTWTVTTRGTVSIRDTTDTNNSRKTFSHELGHNFGCEHIQDGSNIMNSGGYTGHYWNPISVGIINGTLASSSCFTDCQAELCDNKKVENLTVAVDSSNSLINVNWLSEIGMEYRLRLYTYNNNTWSPYVSVSYPQNFLALPYTNTVACGNRYKIEIVPVCSGINGFSQLVTLATTASADYPALSFQSVMQTQLLCSGYSYTFSVHAIYPGTSPIYQWKINGINVGTNSPEFTTSSLNNYDELRCDVISNDPCLLHPTSGAVSTIRVALSQPCTLSNADFNLQNIDYFPNPVKNQFTIKSKTTIKSLSIFNVLGQRLLQNDISDTESILDLSNFPRSTYMIKVELEGFTKTIKIVKE